MVWKVKANNFLRQHTMKFRTKKEATKIYKILRSNNAFKKVRLIKPKRWTNQLSCLWYFGMRFLAGINVYFKFGGLKLWQERKRKDNLEEYTW